MVVLDTDLLSLLERDSGEAATLRRRLRGAEAGAVVTTIINFEEQMRGWLAVVARARTMARQIQAYDRLHRFLENYREIPVLDFDARAPRSFNDCERNTAASVRMTSRLPPLSSQTTPRF